MNQLLRVLANAIYAWCLYTFAMTVSLVEAVIDGRALQAVVLTLGVLAGVYFVVETYKVRKPLNDAYKQAKADR